MSGSLFKNPCNMYSLFWWENCRWLVPGLGMWVIGPGQDTSMLQSIWYTPWFSQELWKHRQLRLVSGCNVYFHCSPFLEHHLSPKSQGRVVLGFSLTPNMWCLYQQHPIPQTPTGYATSPWWSYCRFCRLRAQNSSVQMAAMRSWVNHPCDQICKRGDCGSITPSSNSTTQQNWGLNFGNHWLHSQNRTEGKKMEEMCRQRRREVCPASVP